MKRSPPGQRAPMHSAGTPTPRRTGRAASGSARGPPRPSARPAARLTLGSAPPRMSAQQKPRTCRAASTLAQAPSTADQDNAAASYRPRCQRLSPRPLQAHSFAQLHDNPLAQRHLLPCFQNCQTVKATPPGAAPHALCARPPAQLRDKVWVQSHACTSPTDMPKPHRLPTAGLPLHTRVC